MIAPGVDKFTYIECVMDDALKCMALKINNIAVPGATLTSHFHNCRKVH